MPCGISISGPGGVLLPGCACAVHVHVHCASGVPGEGHLESIRSGLEGWSIRHLLAGWQAGGLVGCRAGSAKASDGSQPFALTIPRRATVEKVRERKLNSLA